MEVSTTQQTPQGRCIRVAEVAEKLSIGVSTVWKYAAQDVSFPQPFSLIPKITVWYEPDVDKFIASKRQPMH